MKKNIAKQLLKANCNNSNPVSEVSCYYGVHSVELVAVLHLQKKKNSLWNFFNYSFEEMNCAS